MKWVNESIENNITELIVEKYITTPTGEFYVSYDANKYRLMAEVLMKGSEFIYSASEILYYFEPEGVEYDYVIYLTEAECSNSCKIKSEYVIKEKCEYCEVDVDNRKSLLTVETDYIDYEIYLDGNNNLTHNDKYDNNKINYCPMCGRELLK